MPYRVASSVVAPPGRHPARALRPPGTRASTTPMSAVAATLLAAALAGLSGCGQRGPLYLPSPATPTTSPAAATPASAPPPAASAPGPAVTR